MNPHLDLRISPVVAPVREQVYRNLRQAIIDMSLKPGQRLIERELVEMTGASRTSVREALRQLTADGLVKTVPHNKTVVAIPDEEEATELYQVRGALESLATERFVECATPQEIGVVREALEEYKRSGGGKLGLAAKDEFYRVVGAHSPTIYSILSALHARISLMRNVSLASPGRHAESVKEMFSILEAIEKGDKEAATKASSFHVAQSHEAAIKYLLELDHGIDEFTGGMANGPE